MSNVMLGIQQPFDLNKRDGPPFSLAFNMGVEDAIKAIIKWGNEPCPHGIGDFHDKDESVTMCCRHACDQCWQELKLSI